MSDSSDIDTAVVQRLASDAQLTALLPDGVWFDDAPQGKQRFALVSLVIARDEGQMAAPGGRRALEDVLYLVRAVLLATNSANAKAAAARIDALLDDHVLTIPGYACLAVQRVERFRGTEVDPVDASLRWQHRGGHYRVLVTRTP